LGHGGDRGHVVEFIEGKGEALSEGALERRCTWCWQGGMHPARIALLLGHRDARMVERVYGVLESGALGSDVAAVFNKPDLPSVPMTDNGQIPVTESRVSLRQKRPAETRRPSASENFQCRAPAQWLRREPRFLL